MGVSDNGNWLYSCIKNSNRREYANMFVFLKDSSFDKVKKNEKMYENRGVFVSNTSLRMRKSDNVKSQGKFF